MFGRLANRVGRRFKGGGGGGGAQSLPVQGDFTYIGSFLAPIPRTTHSTGKTIVASAGDSVWVDASDSNLLNNTLEIMDGPYAGTAGNLYLDEGPGGGGHEYFIYPPLPVDMAGYQYSIYKPYSIHNGDSWAYATLACRYKNGQFRLTSVSGFENAVAEETGMVYEFTPPADELLSKDPDNLPTGTHVYTWDDNLPQAGAMRVSGGTLVKNDFNLDNPPRSLSWTSDTVLWYGYGGDYASEATSPSFMKLVVDNDTDAMTRYGPYRLKTAGGTAISYKRTTGAVLKLPQAWADANVGAGGNARYVVWGQGYMSLFDQQGGSGGTACSLFGEPPNATYDYNGPDDGETGCPTVQGTPLAGYAVASVNAMRRPPGYINRNYYIQYADGACQGAAATTLDLWFVPGAANTNSFDNRSIIMTSGAASGDVRTITGFDPNTGPRVTVNSAWSTTPSVGDTYQIYDGEITSATATSVTLPAAIPNKHFYLKVLSGTGAGQEERYLTLSSGTTYDVSPAFDTTPAPGDRYRCYPEGFDNVPDANAEYGYNTLGDMYGGIVLIDTPTRFGFLVTATLGVRHQFYGQSALRGRGVGQYWFVIDPADLAAVYAGTKQAHEVVPTWWEAAYTDAQGAPQKGYPGRPSPTPEPAAGNISIGARIHARDSTWDSVTGRLYVMDVDNGAEPRRIHVYQGPAP